MIETVLPRIEEIPSNNHTNNVKDTKAAIKKSPDGIEKLPIMPAKIARKYRLIPAESMTLPAILSNFQLSFLSIEK
ncbi:hypothetical protein LSO9J_10087 [Candidatus Liberibacter solanacearum]